MLVYRETFRLPPVEEYWSKPLQFTWCHWVDQGTDTDVRKHCLLDFLFTSCTAITWMPYEQLGVKWWVKLFGYLYDLLIPVLLFAGFSVLCDRVLRRRYSSFPVDEASAIPWGLGHDCTWQRLFWLLTFCTSAALCTGKALFIF